MHPRAALRAAAVPGAVQAAQLPMALPWPPGTQRAGGGGLGGGEDGLAVTSTLPFTRTVTMLLVTRRSPVASAGYPNPIPSRLFVVLFPVLGLFFFQDIEIRSVSISIPSNSFVGMSVLNSFVHVTQPVASPWAPPASSAPSARRSAFSKITPRFACNKHTSPNAVPRMYETQSSM